MKCTVVLAAILAAMTLPAHAQQIVAQSNYVNRTGQTAVPQISITIRADFVLFSVRYITATRAIDARTTELTKMFQTVTQRVQRNNEGIGIEVGQPGNSAALETASLKEVIVKTQNDQSYMDLVFKADVRSNDTFQTIRTRVEKFVADTPVNGRVEAVIGDNQFLGIADPKKHRDTLIKAIADDVKMMQSSFSGPVQVSLTGMEQRTVTRPVGPLDLEIYIPYSMSVRSGAAN
ncbi:MAG: hypothetical protein QM773_15085 [Hyphomonadaceae bacterium]